MKKDWKNCRNSIVPLSRGELRGNPGDWLLQYTPGDYGVVKLDISERTYIKVSENGCRGEPTNQMAQDTQNIRHSVEFTRISFHKFQI
ncbi:MAG: PGDYG domain-containing protein [Synergistaceae bacterium]|nr:PGDYG domain-containing protein [Synergistaceae bacterium]